MKSLCFGPLLLPCPPLSAFNLLRDTAQVICAEAAVDGPPPPMEVRTHLASPLGPSEPLAAPYPLLGFCSFVQTVS